MSRGQVNPMPTGDRRLGAASLRIRQCQALPQAMRPRTRELCDLQVPPALRGQGLASALVHKVCAEADAAGLVLVLAVQPFGEAGGLDADALRAWYAERFGFSLLQERPVVMMARMPGATPRLLSLRPVAAATKVAA